MRKWLKALRISKNLSQSQVANDAGVTAQHYSFIENGDRRPSPQVAKRIAKVLNFEDEWYKLLEPPESAQM